MKIALRVVALVTLVLLPATYKFYPLLLLTVPLVMTTIILTVVASAQRRQYAWLWATVGICGLGIVIPDILGSGIQSAVEQSLASCVEQHGSAACPQSAWQTLLVNGLRDLLLLGLLLIVLLAVVYSFRMRDALPVPMGNPPPTRRPNTLA